MEAIVAVSVFIFLFGYGLIVLEQKVGTHKSAIALVLGGVLWMLAAVYLNGDHETLDSAIVQTGGEIFGLVAFLLAAMAIIEILVHYRLFDLIRSKLIKMNVDDKQEFLVLLVLTFIFSAILDNIAVTIAMLQIARRFFVGKNLLISAAGVVVAANAGGAWSPIGDVTTILLWLSEKFTASEVISYAFLPSLALFIVATALLYRKLEGTADNKREKDDVRRLSPSEKLVVGTALSSFTFPLLMSVVGLPPYIGLLFGLGLTWCVIELAKNKTKNDERQSHMTANIEKIIQTIDLSSVKYIMGILLAVGALGTLGVLTWITQTFIGENPSDAYLIGVNVGLGLLSGVIDNASLVAISIPTIPTDDPLMWSLTAVMAGNGGSLLVVASAAGVVAMGSCKQLTISQYLRIATLPVFVGLIVALAVWLLQFRLLSMI